MRDTFFFFFFFPDNRYYIERERYKYLKWDMGNKAPMEHSQSVPTLDGKWITKQKWAIWETGRVSLIAEQGQIYTSTLLPDQVFQS